mgnify:CR=1 FL=1
MHLQSRHIGFYELIQSVDPICLFLVLELNMFYRINGAVQNSKDFARSFNCPANSNMNPDNKCYVW